MKLALRYKDQTLKGEQNKLENLLKEIQESVEEAIINNWILIFGPMKYLVSDNGGEFAARISKAITMVFKIKRIFTSGYNSVQRPG